MQQRLDDLTPGEIRTRMRDGTLCIGVGPFNVGVRSTLPQVRELVTLFYGGCRLASPDALRHHLLEISLPASPRRWVRPYIRFDGDGDSPFEPAPKSLAYPTLEWGFNWRVAATAHQYLLLHSAVIERKGTTVLMPALPGSGKSTLAAALMHSGWRLLSDEFGLVRPGTTTFVPFPRPIPLKNESIGVVRAFAPEAVLGPTFTGTRKGDIAHCRPTEESRRADQTPATVTHVVFPSYQQSAATTVHDFAKSRAFMKLCGNSFNYKVLGADGFDTVGRIVEESDCLSFTYGDLAEAIAWFERLTD